MGIVTGNLLLLLHQKAAYIHIKITVNSEITVFSSVITELPLT